MNDWQVSENEVICKVAGIIVRNRKLLLTRTRGTDLFLSPGGKPLAGEDPEEALRRELAEETGLVTIQADYFGRFEGDLRIRTNEEDCYGCLSGGCGGRSISRTRDFRAYLGRRRSPQDRDWSRLCLQA